MQITSRFAEIKSRLHKSGFRPSRWPEHLDSPRRATGFLRAIVHEDDHRVQLIRFAANEMVEWELDLSMSLPVAVLDAALTAACVDIGAQTMTAGRRSTGVRLARQS